VRRLYGHRDHERALDRVTAAYGRTASFTQMQLGDAQMPSPAADTVLRYEFKRQAPQRHLRPRRRCGATRREVQAGASRSGQVQWRSSVNLASGWNRRT
jgi:hypothetical protein